jgi:lipoyl(octanoyl) transferase
LGLDAQSPIPATWLGRVDYDAACKLQIAERDRVIAGESPGTLLLLEHEPVITVGRRGELDDLPHPVARLAAEGILFRTAARGGRATYHGPGQIVGYPVGRLRSLAPDVPTYVWRLEEALIVVAGSLGVEATRAPAARGVWVGDRKLGAVGIAITRGVCWHGFALNVGACLDGFRLIRPCGLDAAATTLSDHVDPPPVEDVATLIADALAAVFGGRIGPLAPTSM